MSVRISGPSCCLARANLHARNKRDCPTGVILITVGIMITSVTVGIVTITVMNMSTSVRARTQTASPQAHRIADSARQHTA